MPHNASGASSWLHQFLDVLHEFKREIEERWAEYFEYQALRYHCPSVERTFADLCESLGQVYGLNLIVETDLSKLNSIDLLFQARLDDLPRYEPVTELITQEKQEQLKLLEAIRERQDEARANANATAATIPTRLTKKTIDRDGSAITYFVSGEGDSTIVILNALGHGLAYWHRLLDYLLERHRVVIPESPDPTSLELICRHEKIEQAHLLGWCTGPKAAVAFYRRCPSLVTSLILLNSSFKCSGDGTELATPYEHHLEPLCRSLLDQPAMAGVVMNMFLSNTGRHDPQFLSRMRGEELATAVLSQTNEHLKDHIVGPFHSPEATLVYARQSLDFLAYDAVADAREVRAPVMLVGAEYDAIASPATTDFMAQQFPHAQSLNIRGATHYVIYDRPRFIADLIKKFLADLEAPAITTHVQRLSSSPETLWT